jgi:hypothetical protein
MDNNLLPFRSLSPALFPSKSTISIVQIKQVLETFDMDIFFFFHFGPCGIPSIVLFILSIFPLTHPAITSRADIPGYTLSRGVASQGL